VNNAYDQEQRARLKAQRDAEKDPQLREAYALAERAGFDWYDTESAARRMAEHAAGENLAMHGSLVDIALGADMMLQAPIAIPAQVRHYIEGVKRMAEAALDFRRPPRRAAMTPTHTGVHP